MFYFEEINKHYFIWSDYIKGKYGPFKGVFVKNKYLGDIGKEDIDEKKYPGYKYSIGIGSNKIFIISKDGDIELKDINN